MSIGTPPKPLLPRRTEERLGPRHREILDQLEMVFLSEGFSSVTVTQLAASVGCSRRTLYELAPSKDALVLIVLDRFLHRVGRTALNNVDPNESIAEQVRSYINGALELQRLTAAFADDLADDPAARRLLDRHFRYVMSVSESLIERGIEAGEFRSVSPGVAAGMLAGSGLYFSQPGILDDVGMTRDEASHEMTDIVLRSLLHSTIHSPTQQTSSTQ
ncbi:MAG: TetR/AcrR family transcriptional regulator [Ilumatobacter sp.]|uniref:TetR/AcrR family transcriptional regulator n=1 Tax=Ilumatobacter sp. TaxID=1967498 RepID=UPI001D38163D|nr:TetR/AcrR family transcriptional regulator [Ilumatobacter sp.]MBT5277790.1 TetR/AcrR family transcriptional regulator [Ilumatobacter sp.]MBT5554329.1 TetR/AcrR family transcriptional regulator [Ilumatobacter sp.]MBT5866460.1 TetR/AcrR family transcriptional regulator [Ilumatobacter sp.]MBT7430478.1 TetR/AcrR family transcriptional regulator [Ilumatobacter sp.]